MENSTTVTMHGVIEFVCKCLFLFANKYFQMHFVCSKNKDVGKIKLAPENAFHAI